jgi:hypothetical protein
VTRVNVILADEGLQKIYNAIDVATWYEFSFSNYSKHSRLALDVRQYNISTVLTSNLAFEAIIYFTIR